jgi:hypothetical protein
MAGEGSGGVIFAGREHTARVSLSVLSRREHRILAALLIRHPARPRREAMHFARLHNVNSLQ